jgi:hypothetical protein
MKNLLQKSKKKKDNNCQNNMPEKNDKRKDTIDGGEKISRDWFENTIRKEYNKVIEKPKVEPAEKSNQKNKLP